MNNDRLYQLAFEYKKTKLWKKLWDRDVFAVQLSKDRIGYISIMGAIGEHCALGLYIGEEGLRSLRMLMNGMDEAGTPFARHEQLLQQSCLQCAFDSKDYVSEEEQEAARVYAKAHGIRIAGQNAFPHFVKYQPNRFPWCLQTRREQEDLCQALTAALEMAKYLEKKEAWDLGLHPMDEDTQRILLMKPQGDRYVLDTTDLPEITPVPVPVPTICNDIQVEKLRRMKKQGTWECEVIRIPEPVQNAPDEIPSYPVLLLAVKAGAHYVLPTMMAEHYEENPNELLGNFINSLLAENVCPAKIKVRDDRTYAFMKILCNRLQIPLQRDPELSALDQAEMDLWEHMNAQDPEADVLDLLDTLLEIKEEMHTDIPEALREELLALLESQDISQESVNKIQRCLESETKDFSKTGKGKRNVSGESYVISVSLGTGCYRHIRIAVNAGLEELHAAILDAFDFEDDHAYAFFMDNRAWSDMDSFYDPDVAEPDDRPADRYSLEQAGLHPGLSFKYLFDFGEEWLFQCKVLRIVEEMTETPAILRSKGEAPPQYKEWDDEWDDE